MRGVELRVDATPVVDLARERGLLVNRTDEKVVRLLPPLTIDAADIDRGDRHPRRACSPQSPPRCTHERTADLRFDD